MADRHGRDSAPDLRILGDQITLQPSGFVEPSKAAHREGEREEGREEPLMKNMARFRSEPLQYVIRIPSCKHRVLASPELEAPRPPCSYFSAAPRLSQL